MKTADDLINNYQLFSTAMQAYGLQDFTYAKAFMKKVLTSDLSDPNSFVNKLTDTRYKTFAQAFQFNTAGNLTNSAVAQSSDQTKDMVSLYNKATGATDPSTPSAEAQFMQTAVASLTSIGDLTGNSRLFSDVLTAYGLDPTTSAQTVTAALESDRSDPNSSVNQSGQAGLQKLAADFNFSATGTVTTQRLAQTAASFSAMASAYTAQAGTDAASKSAAAAETTYVGGAIEAATSIDDIVNDPRIVAYIGKAFDEPKITAAVLRSVLTSDPSDPKSKANVLGTNYAQIAGAFEFTKTGTIAREPAATAQSKTQLATTNSAYLEQTVEDEAGTNNPGTQLALYFARKAPTLTNAYQVLADPALLKVAQTLLGLPAAASTTDIDVQAKQISNGIKFTDLTNPVKLNALVSRFAALYDVANPSSTAQDNISLLFGGSSDSSSSTASLL